MSLDQIKGFFFQNKSHKPGSFEYNMSAYIKGELDIFGMLSKRARASKQFCSASLFDSVHFFSGHRFSSEKKRTRRI